MSLNSRALEAVDIYIIANCGKDSAVPLTPKDVVLAESFAGEMDSDSFHLGQPSGKAANAAEPEDDRSEAERVCGEAYQVVGSLLSDLGIFGSPEGDKILDNLSEARMVHGDVLPWASYEPPEAAALQAELASLRESRDALVKALEATLCAMERARSNMQYAISDKPVRDAAETYGECAYAEQIARTALVAAKETK